ncbi:MAG: type II toxin-antitoxin system HicA family toxin [Acidobacteriaceae bacterium]|nr:type II toxin-antitoxin system HicA family toxin [Acidobacteriaceae bacterium]MBV9678855.1 type II toxin-antitoxin system HicA family toxin [Acidobacteriaceae bacterium]
MSQHEKLLSRLKQKPKDFTWSELETLLAGLGYKQEPGRGSRRKFVHAKTAVMISLHKPHPGHELKAYQVREILAHLKEEKYL